MAKEKVRLKPLHEICLIDELRPNLAFIQIRNKTATASNGIVLIKMQLSNMSFINSSTQAPDLNEEYIQKLEGKYIHRNVWKEMSNCDYLEFDDQYIFVHKDGIVKMFTWGEPNGEFFNSDDIVLDIKEAGTEAKKIMTYDTELISSISSCFETSQLHFSFSKGDKGTFVYPDEHSGMFAVLMPINSDGINRYCFI